MRLLDFHVYKIRISSFYRKSRITQSVLAMRLKNVEKEKRRKQVLDLLAQSPQSARQIASTLNYDPRFVVSLLKELRYERQVELVSSVGWFAYLSPEREPHDA